MQGMIVMWDVDGGLPQIDKYLYTEDSNIVAGALLAVGIVNSGVRDECDPVSASGAPPLFLQHGPDMSRPPSHFTCSCLLRWRADPGADGPAVCSPGAPSLRRRRMPCCATRWRRMSPPSASGPSWDWDSHTLAPARRRWVCPAELGGVRGRPWCFGKNVALVHVARLSV